jgi:hypothetical protein
MFQNSKSRFIALFLCFVSMLPVAAWACSSSKAQSLKSFEACLKDGCGDACLDAFDPYFQKNPNQAYAAGKLVRLHVHAAKALPYFFTALKPQPSAAEARCKDPDVMLAIDAGLYLPHGEQNAGLARRLLAEECAASFLPLAQKALESDGENRYLKANACPVLISKNAAPAACLSTAPNLVPPSQ